MTTSGPRSGKHAVVNSVPMLMAWSINDIDQLTSIYHSASDGGPERKTGVKDFNGTIEGYSVLPPWFPGETATLSLFSGPATGVIGAQGRLWTAPVIFDTMTINWNWGPNQVYNWSLGFSGNGILSSTDGVIDDASVLCPPRMCGLTVNYDESVCTGTGGTFTEWPNVESMTWTVTAQNQPVVNSSTDCYTERRAGNIDYTLDITDQEDYQLINKDDSIALKLYVTATTYWYLEWALLADISNYRVDRSTGAIKSKQNNFAMNGRLCCGAAASLGRIVNPSGIQKWPIAA